MASTSETGHEKNVDNFRLLISRVKQFGTAYDPSIDRLTVAKLEQKALEAQQALEVVRNARTGQEVGVNSRHRAYDDLRQLATRILNMVEASGADQDTIDDIKSINRRLQGKRAGKPAEADPQDPDAPKTISVSRQSFDSLAENFANLIDRLRSIPEYDPNKTDLKVASLQAKLDEMRTSTTERNDTDSSLMTARNRRDTVLYAEPDGLVPTAANVKKYVKADFGAESPEFKDISGIKFTDKP